MVFSVLRKSHRGGIPLYRADDQNPRINISNDKMFIHEDFAINQFNLGPGGWLSNLVFCQGLPWWPGRDQPYRDNRNAKIPKALFYDFKKHEWVMIHVQGEKWGRRLEREEDREEEEQGNPMWHKLVENVLSHEPTMLKVKVKCSPHAIILFTSMFFFLLRLAAYPSTQTRSLIPRIYWLSAESLSVSGSQPLPSTSMHCDAPLSFLVTLSPPYCFITSIPPTTT